MQSIAHGVVLLEQLNPEYGSERRRLRVRQVPRRASFAAATTTTSIRSGGIEVFPRLVAAEHRQSPSRRKLASGIAELDALLGGGIEEGTSTLIVGAAGTGKSTLAAQFAAAAARARRALLRCSCSTKSPHTLLSRCAALGMPLERARRVGGISACNRSIPPS